MRGEGGEGGYNRSEMTYPFTGVSLIRVSCYDHLVLKSIKIRILHLPQLTLKNISAT